MQKITAGLYAQIEQTVRAEIEIEVTALKFASEALVENKMETCARIDFGQKMRLVVSNVPVVIKTNH